MQIYKNEREENICVVLTKTKLSIFLPMRLTQCMEIFTVALNRASPTLNRENIFKSDNLDLHKEQLNIF